MGKGLHKVFSTVVKNISQELIPLGESGSEVSHFIQEPRNFAEIIKRSENIKKPCEDNAFCKEWRNMKDAQTQLV